MGVLLALAAAVSWGVSDFLGGRAEAATTQDRTAAITTWVQLLGLLGLGTLSATVGGGTLTGQDAVLGAAAGLFGAVGIATLYRGLSVGTISVVAPVTGVIAASLPVVFGVATGERPAALVWVGIVAAIGSITLVAREEAVDGARTVNRQAMAYAAAAGIGFAGIFLLLDLTSAESGLWPLVPLKVTGLAVTFSWMIASGTPRTPARHTWPLVLGVGILDNLANVAYLLATREGLLAIVAVLSSLYPAFTVLLARFVLGERLQRVQLAGMGLAGAGVVLIAVG